MTSFPTYSGHQATATTGRSLRAPIRVFFALALAVAALPAFADPALSMGLASDSADAPAPTTRTLLPDSMGLSDRALLLASDFQRRVGPAEPASPAETGRVKTMLERALGLLGTPYRWGGTSPDGGFDCSGLVGYVFRNALGIELPRVSREMAKSGRLISDRAALNEGDLVFFGRKGRVDHVGIYLGEGRFVHAPSTGKDVMVSSLDGGYWGNKFMSARRVAGI
ncbi:C40 family peptidase [Lysobacter koreensis]|uniref:C40 family peptidase n=1 Tax=Lysobacter koreensis TaxID=266122 RepID=A0ABW2YRA6_9GAMM